MTTTTLVTGITTISAITLSEDFSISDVVEHLKEVGSWINSWLPKNCVVRSLFYGTSAIIGLRMIPFLLRKTSFFKNVEIQSRYFHRSTFHPDLLKIKGDLLRELRDETNDLPLCRDGKLTLLELNVGGGTNLSYYPDGCRLIATDYWHGAKEYLEQNFSETEEEPRITLDRFILTIPERLISVADSSVSAVVCFHSLCSSSNVNLALLEIKRVLMPGGKVYIIEHVPTKRKYSHLWVAQLNFKIQMHMWDCHFADFQQHIERAGFSRLHLSEIELNFKEIRMRGPMMSLSPHIYGVAVK